MFVIYGWVGRIRTYDAGVKVQKLNQLADDPMNGGPYGI